MLNTHLKFKKKIWYFKYENKTTSKCHQVTVNKWVIVIKPNHMNSWFIQEQNTMLLRDKKLCTVAVFGIIFVVETKLFLLSEQKQAIWWNASLLINLLYINLL